MHSLFIPALKGGKETLGAAGSGAHCCLLVNQPNMLCLAAVPRAGIPCDSSEPPLLPQTRAGCWKLAPTRVGRQQMSFSDDARSHSV